jgi:hypothetical protein
VHTREGASWALHRRDSNTHQAFVGIGVPIKKEAELHLSGAVADPDPPQRAWDFEAVRKPRECDVFLCFQVKCVPSSLCVLLAV